MADGDSPTPTPSSSTATRRSITRRLGSMAITGIHVRGEAGNDDFTATQNVSVAALALRRQWDKYLDGRFRNERDRGWQRRRTSFIAATASVRPRPSMTTMRPPPGLADLFPGHDDLWLLDQPSVAGAFNGEEQSHAENSGPDTAEWTFANLDPSGYYDVYVTWSPIAGASMAAQYSVDGGGSLPAVNQTQAPSDLQAAGVFWHDLGVFQATTGALVVQLSTGSTDTTGDLLANAAMIVPETTVALTNLVMDTFGVDSSGNLAVTYTVNGEDSPPFSIGIYGSAGRHPAGHAAPDRRNRRPHPACRRRPDLYGQHPGRPCDIGDSSQYLVAKLDCYDQVAGDEQGRQRSRPPLSGAFQNSDRHSLCFW